ncbi:MAG: ATP-binding cassette domain-containing protein [Blautia faecicola]
MAFFEIRNLTFTYPDQKIPALVDLNFSLKQGEFLVVCGKSGCGKSTLLRHFKTAMAPYGERRGEILFEGRELDTVSVREQGARIGYVLQSPDNQLVTDKVWHELAFGLENLGYETGTIRLRVAEMASFFGIQTWFEKNVEELSGGQKQLLNLAAVMAMQPDLLVLDEPTSQLDPLAAGDFLATLRKINAELGTTILLIEHRLEEVLAYADRVLVMENGGILALDAPEKLPAFIRENDMFQAMPVPMRIFEELSGEGDSPVTVREGREWLEEWIEEKKRLGNGYENRTEAFGKQPDTQKFGAVAIRENNRKSADTQLDAQKSETVEIQEKGRKPSLFGLFSQKSAKGSEDQQPQTVLEARDVWFRYEKELPDVVRDLNLKVQKGELYCLLGGNGTGKSTTLRLLGRIRKPYRGKLFLNGKELGTYRENELYGSLLGILPQNPQSLFVKDTVEKDLREMSGDTERLRDVIEKTEIGHLLGSHPYDLSGGEQQRAALAKVLLLDPKIILLDEPTKGLDGFYKKKLAQILKGLTAEGKTILMVSHDIEFCAEYGDTCALFFHGSVVTSAPAREFFAGNSFYTTAANRMARKWYPDAVTAKDVIERCRER